MADVFRASKPVGGDFDDSPLSSNKKIPAYGKEGRGVPNENRLSQDIVNPTIQLKGGSPVDIYSVASSITSKDVIALAGSAPRIGAAKLGRAPADVGKTIQQGVKVASQQAGALLGQLEYVPAPASLPMTGELLSSAAQLLISGANNLLSWMGNDFLPAAKQRWSSGAIFWGKAAPIVSSEARHLVDEVRPTVQGAIHSVQPTINATSDTAKSALQQGWDGICKGACVLRDEVCEGACFIADRAALLEGKAVDAVKGVHLPSVDVKGIKQALPVPSAKVNVKVPDVKGTVQPEKENEYQKLMDRVAVKNTSLAVPAAIASTATVISEKAAEVLPILQQTIQQTTTTTTAAISQKVKSTVQASGQPSQPSQLQRVDDAEAKASWDKWHAQHPIDEQSQQAGDATVTKLVTMDPGKTNVDQAIRKQKAEQ